MKERSPQQHRTHPAIWASIAIWAFLLTIPAWVFFDQRGGMSFLDGASFAAAARLLFPLAGLYAFAFLWTQLILGSGMTFWIKFAPAFYRFHKVFGVVTFFFALTHPLLLFIGIGAKAYFSRSFVPAELMLFVWMGYGMVLLLCCTVAAGLLMRTRLLRRHWCKVHIANYGVFLLAVVHSWNLGSDIQETPLQYLWRFFIVTGTCAMLVRLFLVIRRRRMRVFSSQAPPFPPK